MQKAIQQNAKKTTNHFQGYRTEVLREISAVKVRTKIASESARQTLAQIGAICWHELRVAPRWVIIFPPRRILDQPWRRDRKNDQCDAEKPILRKTASRRDETAPGLNNNGFFHVRLRFTPFRLQLTAVPGRHSGDPDFLRRHLLVYNSNRVYGCARNGAGADNSTTGPRRSSTQSSAPKIEDPPFSIFRTRRSKTSQLRSSDPEDRRTPLIFNFRSSEPKTEEPPSSIFGSEEWVEDRTRDGGGGGDFFEDGRVLRR